MLDFPYSFNFFYIILNVTDKLQISNRILKCVFLTGRKEHSEKAVLKSEFSFFVCIFHIFHAIAVKWFLSMLFKRC